MQLVNPEAGRGEQFAPAVEHIKTDVGAVEQAFVVLREAAEQDVEPEVEIAAVGQGGYQLAIGLKQRDEQVSRAPGSRRCSVSAQRI